MTTLHPPEDVHVWPIPQKDMRNLCTEQERGKHAPVWKQAVYFGAPKHRKWLHSITADGAVRVGALADGLPRGAVLLDRRDAARRRLGGEAVQREEDWLH